MNIYYNLSGNSGVYAYSYPPEGIAVQFRDGHTYLYTIAGVGLHHVQQMRTLAAQGRGLNTYINQHPDVRGGYSQKY